MAAKKEEIGFSAVFEEVLRAILDLPGDPEIEILKRKKEDAKLRLRAKYLSERNISKRISELSESCPGSASPRKPGAGTAPARSYESLPISAFGVFIKTYPNFRSSIPELIRSSDPDDPRISQAKYKFEEFIDKYVDLYDFWNMLVEWNRSQSR